MASEPHRRSRSMDVAGHEWLDVPKCAVREFIADDCVGLAQQVAYASLLAFFPAVLFLVGLLGFVGAYDELERFLRPVAPGAVLSVVETLHRDAATRAGSGLAIAAGAAGALWAGSGAAASIVKAVNRAYDLRETRPFWKVRLVGLALVVASGLVVTGTLLLVVFGGPLGRAIAAHAHVGGAFTWTWSLLRWPIAFAAVLLLFGIIYSFAPDQQPRTWTWITPGAVAGALLWLAISALFALYTSRSGTYSRTYGSLAAGIVLLLWLYLTSLAVLLGAELNAELKRRAQGIARPRRA